MNDTTTENPHLKNIDDLVSYMDYDAFIYMLKELYRLVFTAKRTRQSASDLQATVRQFEEHADLPPFLSVMPVNELIDQLDDLQYFYPIVSREINLPRFNKQGIIS
ncbi:MAG: hypothetical protein K2Q14_04785 [Gammaproteobacteria bacterium]|nr:hypothetical protein [Gammaproteobacteria bacterium]MBY0544848.1 hypothetical protein [Gammaproteobacteria bacterium]